MNTEEVEQSYQQIGTFDHHIEYVCDNFKIAKPPSALYVNPQGNVSPKNLDMERIDCHVHPAPRPRTYVT